MKIKGKIAGYECDLDVELTEKDVKLLLVLAGQNIYSAIYLGKELSK